VSHLHHKVSALIDGELSLHARARALSHARGCPQCRQEIAETLEVKQRVTELAPAEVSADLLDVLASAVPPRVVPCPAGGPPLLRRVFVGVGSMSAVVIALPRSRRRSTSSRPGSPTAPGWRRSPTRRSTPSPR
jgi:anti-sigma factor RsiW